MDVNINTKVLSSSRVNSFNNVLDTIGYSPLVKINQMTKHLQCSVYGKVEAFNPGLSAKDRIAMFMVEKAEKEGLLKKGDTLIEATSGNTGFALAMVGAIKGYTCILTLPDKVSVSKINLLRAMGAEVVICPSNVKPEDPRSYYSRAETLAKEIKNGFYVNQNFDLNNGEAHYHSTGPEIWEQSQGKITHFVAAVGTGGTISGTSRYLKEKNPNIKIIGVDAYGSVLKKFHETGSFDDSDINPYKLEGVGKSIIPGNVNFDIIDEFVKVSDKDAAYAARDLARKEGLFLGYSSGSVIDAIIQMQSRFSKDDYVVGLFSDHGSRYLDKIYNDTWMAEQGF